MKKVTVSELRDCLKLAIEADIPLMIWGLRGVGKSSIVKQFCEDIQACFIDVRLPYYEAVELKGVPDLHTNKDFTHFKAFDFLPWEGTDFPDDKTIVLFLDELPQSPHDVQKAAFQLVLDRQLGQYKLKPNVRIVAAGNLLHEFAGTEIMLDPLKGRFLHVQLQPTINQWVEYMHDKYQHSWVLTILTRFFSEHAEYFCMEADNVEEPAIAQPRTWEMVVRLSQHKTIDSAEALRYLAQMACGDAAAGALAAFADDLFRGFNMELLQAQPETYRIPTSPEEIELLARALLASDPKTLDYGALLVYFGRLYPEVKRALVTEIAETPSWASAIPGGETLDAPSIKFADLVFTEYMAAAAQESSASSEDAF